MAPAWISRIASGPTLLCCGITVPIAIYRQDMILNPIDWWRAALFFQCIRQFLIGFGSLWGSFIQKSLLSWTRLAVCQRCEFRPIPIWSQRRKRHHPLLWKSLPFPRTWVCSCCSWSHLSACWIGNSVTGVYSRRAWQLWSCVLPFLSGFLGRGADWDTRKCISRSP